MQRCPPLSLSKSIPAHTHLQGWAGSLSKLPRCTQSLGTISRPVGARTTKDVAINLAWPSDKQNVRSSAPKHVEQIPTQAPRLPLCPDNARTDKQGRASPTNAPRPLTTPLHRKTHELRGDRENFTAMTKASVNFKPRPADGVQSGCGSGAKGSPEKPLQPYGCKSLPIKANEKQI